MDIVLLGTLRGQHEGLHEPSHGLAIVAQLPRHLDHHTIGQGLMAVHLSDLGMTVSEVESHDLLVYLLLAVHCLGIPPRVQPAVDEAGVVGVEAVQVERGLVEECVILPDKLTTNALRGGGFHDHCTPDQQQQTIN